LRLRFVVCRFFLFAVRLFFLSTQSSFFSLRLHGAQSLSFLITAFFGFQISRALVNPEKWAAQSCQTSQSLDLIFNPPRKRNPWSNTQLVKTHLNSKKSRATLRSIIVKLPLKNREKKGVSKCLKTKIIFKKRACWFLPICIQRFE
jgi:hypothetical protein